MNAQVIQFPAADPLDNVPGALCDLRGWLVWELTDDGRKVPYYVSGERRSGEQGSPEDREKLSTFEEARARFRRGGFTGIGLAMLPDWHVTALDFDDCVTDGVVHQDVQRLVTGTYAELSPSGKGVRAFMRGQLAGADKSAAGLAEHGFKFECYPVKQFVTVTGNAINWTDADELGGSSLCDLTDAVREHAALRFPKREEREESDGVDDKPHALTAEDVREMLTHIADNIDRDSWCKVCWAAERATLTSKDGTLTHGAVLDLVDEWSRRDKPESYQGRRDVEKKMLEALKRDDGYNVGTLWNLAKAGGWEPSAEQIQRRFPGSGPATDDEFTDYSQAEPTGEATSRKPDPLRFQPLAEFTGRPFPRWLIKGLLPECDVGMVYGASGSGKSFLCWDIACSLSRGVAEWGGKRAQLTKCGWIAAEAVGSVGPRAQAYAMHHKLPAESLQVPVLAAVPDLGNPKHVERIIAGVKEHGIQLLFIDTLAAVRGERDENSAEMQVVMNGARDIRNSTGATVIVIHHAGKDATKGARGSSAIRATVDVEWEVERQDEVRNVTITKQRDGRDGQAFAYKLVPLTIGYDEDGDSVTSCVIEHCEPVKKNKPPKLGHVQQIVMDVLQSEFGSVPTEELVKAVVERMVHDESSGRDLRKHHALRAINGLVDRRLINIVNGNLIALALPPTGRIEPSKSRGPATDDEFVDYSQIPASDSYEPLNEPTLGPEGADPLKEGLLRGEQPSASCR